MHLHEGIWNITKLCHYDTQRFGFSRGSQLVKVARDRESFDIWNPLVALLFFFFKNSALDIIQEAVIAIYAKSKVGPYSYVVKKKNWYIYAYLGGYLDVLKSGRRVYISNLGKEQDCVLVQLTVDTFFRDMKIDLKSQ